MKTIFIHIILLISLQLAGQVQIKDDSVPPRYYIEQGEVVYEFKKSREDSSNQNEIYIKDFDDFNVYEVIESGRVEDWSSDGWFMRKINEFTYQLRKKLEDFTDQFNYNQKYYLHRDYWLEPTSELDLINENVSGLNLIDEQGNSTFELKDYLDANKVILAGSFNNWSEEELSMKSDRGGWTLTLDLPPGIHEYKFIVDGEWMHDPQNELLIENQHHTFNSILLIGQMVQFHLSDLERAKKVFLAGSFNNWEPQTIPLTKSSDGWIGTIPLPPGKHYYKFVVDGEWILDPHNDLKQKDRHGIFNSVMIVY